MRVLLINNFHYLRGGDYRYTTDLASLLTNHGHQIVHFSMHHPNNEPDENERFFVPFIDYALMNRQRDLSSVYRVLTTSYWSRAAQKNLLALLRTFKPDVAHLQGILHHMSPSVIPVLADHGIPIVHHLHDYNLICPDIYLARAGRICEECFGGRYFKCVIHRCKKGSVLASLLAASQRYLHQVIGVFGKVAYFVSPSAFAMRKFSEARFPYIDRVVHIPHFVDTRCVVPNWDFEHTQGVLFAGRLIPQKGILTLLRAASEVPHLQITVLGDGELADKVRAEISERRLHNVRLRGWQPQTEVMHELRSARALVMPSEWYETSGLSALEAAALGRAVVVSSNTAMTEIVKDGETGFVFEMGDSKRLAACLDAVCSNPTTAEIFGRQARAQVELTYDAEKHYSLMMNLYESAIRRLR